jgi:hypothetical protein
MSYRVNQSIVPPGGWECPAEPGSPVMIKAQSYSNLLQEVLKYRIQSKMRYNNLQEEVDVYLSSISPTTVVRQKGPLKKTPVNLADLIYNWLCDVFDRGGNRHYVARPNADARAEVCARCPRNNQRDHISSCGPCREASAAMVRVVRGNRETGLDAMLGGCVVFNYELSLAVHLDEDTLGPLSTDIRLPLNCWRKAK